MDLTQLRAEFPTLAKYAYMNTGSTGPLPGCVGEAIVNEINYQVAESRGGNDYYPDRVIPGRADLRTLFAGLVGADDDEIALTHHTTEGLNIVVWGMPWQPGDEIITTSLEHPGGLLPVYVAAKRLGLRLRVVDLGHGDQDVVERIKEVISYRTQLVVISQVMWTTGAVVPLAEIAEAVHEVGGLIAVDGAQSAGAIPVNVKDLGVDFFTVSGQKWLCGPEGVGALYVKREHLETVSPTMVGYSTMRDPEALDFTGYFMPHPNARRYEMGTVLWPKMAGMRAGLQWLTENVGLDEIFNRTQKITRHARERLAAAPGVTIHSPEPHAGLTTFSVEGLESEPTVLKLADHGVIIRCFSHPTWMRASTGFFNSEQDVQQLIDGLEKLQKTT